jgi:FkbM family methyltransferase
MSPSWQNEFPLAVTIADLLSESVPDAQRREICAMESMLSDSGQRVILFGAGSLGRKALAALRRRGIEPLAFADNDPGIQGKRVDGIDVIAPASAAIKWRNDALFVVTIFLPNGGGMKARIAELIGFGCRQITTFLPLGWTDSGMFPHFGADLPSRLLVEARDLRRVAALWSDKQSREIFRQQLGWRLQADFGSVSAPSTEQYFPKDLLVPDPQEVFVDGGAFDGDTLRAAPWPLASVHAIEPDPENATKIHTRIPMEITIHRVLLGRTIGSTRFDSRGTMASSRSETGGISIEVQTLDNLLIAERPSFIKLDVEGDELDALEGARKTLYRAQPVVAVCVYHRPEDLWKIPLFLDEVLPHHRKYLRAHAYDGFELVAYAIPKDRCVTSI